MSELWIVDIRFTPAGPVATARDSLVPYRYPPDTRDDELASTLEVNSAAAARLLADAINGTVPA